MLLYRYWFQSHIRYTHPSGLMNKLHCSFSATRPCVGSNSRFPDISNEKNVTQHRYPLRMCLQESRLITVNSFVFFPPLFSLSLSLSEMKTRETNTVSTAVDTIVTEANRTRNERFVRVDRTNQRVTPAIDLLSQNSW